MDNMVDDKDNHVDYQDDKSLPSWEVPLLLLGGFRSIVDQAHVLLAERGHPGVRPVHGFALQAIGAGATASELGDRLGVTKQAAAKTVAMLEEAGYVDRSGDPHDARRKVVTPTRRGRELLAASALAFGDVVDEWAAVVGRGEISRLHDTLRTLGVGRAARLDLGAWSGSG
jgi:DNA-binding MarR family transcriptional regulator